MKEVFKNIYHVGDSGCSVYLIDTKSEDGLVLIDCGINVGSREPNQMFPYFNAPREESSESHD